MYYWVEVLCWSNPIPWAVAGGRRRLRGGVQERRKGWWWEWETVREGDSILLVKEGFGTKGKEEEEEEERSFLRQKGEKRGGEGRYREGRCCVRVCVYGREREYGTYNYKDFHPRRRERDFPLKFGDSLIPLPCCELPLPKRGSQLEVGGKDISAM